MLELLNACTPPLSRPPLVITPPLSRGDLEALAAGVLGAGLDGAATAGFAPDPAASTCAGGVAAGGASAAAAATSAGAASVVGAAAGDAAAGCGGGGGGGGGWLTGVASVRLSGGDEWPRLSEGPGCGAASSPREPSAVAAPRSDAGGADWPSRCCPPPSSVPPGANGCPAPSSGPCPASTAASIRSDSWRST